MHMANTMNACFTAAGRAGPTETRERRGQGQLLRRSEYKAIPVPRVTMHVVFPALPAWLTAQLQPSRHATPPSHASLPCRPRALARSHVSHGNTGTMERMGVSHMAGPKVPVMKVTSAST